MNSFPSYLILIICILIHSCNCLSTPKASSWQRRLDKALLDIDATPKSRFRNLERALQDPNLPTDINSAIDAIRTKGFGKGHPDFINILWPVGTTARSDLEGLTALRTQVPEALRELPDLVKTSQGQISKKSSNPPKSADFNSLPKPDEIKEELKNALRSTPKGLEAPKYSVARVIDGAMSLGVPEKIEIRKYEAFTVASTPSMGGAGFNTLASYLFGGNEEEKAMSMTMPVFVTGRNGKDQNSPGTMQFVLPSEMSDEPPTPLSDEAVNIERIPERFVAVKAFPGLVTEDEVSRQKDALLNALEGADVNVVNEDEVSVLQYNSPLTIPWRRRNEIAFVIEVVQDEPDVEESDASDAWYTRMVATSWYDAGVRL